jgi:hypothetical protein
MTARTNTTINSKHVSSTLVAAGHKAATFDVAENYLPGFVVYRVAKENATYVRYEAGLSGRGKRVSEVLPAHQDNVEAYREALDAKDYVTELVDSDPPGFPEVHIMEYNGPAIVTPEPTRREGGFDRKAYQAERRRKMREQSGTLVEPGTYNPGEIYVLIGGHNRFKGKLVEIVEVNEDGYVATVRTAAGITMNVRLTSLGEQKSVAEFNAVKGPTRKVIAPAPQREADEEEPEDEDEELENEPDEDEEEESDEDEEEAE